MKRKFISFGSLLLMLVLVSSAFADVIIDNPGFEDNGGSLDNWTFLRNCSLSAADAGYGGTGYAADLLIDPLLDPVNEGGSAVISQLITSELTAGVEYAFTVQVKVVSLGTGWSNVNGFRLGRYGDLDKYWETVAINLTSSDWQTLELGHTWTAEELDGGGAYPDGHNVNVGVSLNRYDSVGDTEILVDNFTIMVIPEPATIALLALGGLPLIRRKR